MVLNNAVFEGVSTWRDARLSITDAVDADGKLLHRGSYVTKYTSSRTTVCARRFGLARQGRFST